MVRPYSNNTEEMPDFKPPAIQMCCYTDEVREVLSWREQYASAMRAFVTAAATWVGEAKWWPF